MLNVPVSAPNKVGNGSSRGTWGVVRRRNALRYLPEGGNGGVSAAAPPSQEITFTSSRSSGTLRLSPLYRRVTKIAQ